ncbi:MAG TPA: hypothetical protein VEB19_02735 [Gemmatimonadaceae bacterium]|nr:hypothetical protein [Gemmatimonadaceae bacterium]
MQQAVGTETNSVEKRRAERLFNRDLPGGGYVAIELSDRNGGGNRRVRVLVERRSDRNRRVGHAPPVILEEDWTPERGFGELYRVACDNVAIARALLKLQRAD